MYDLSHEKYKVDTLRPVVQKLAGKQRKYKPEQGESVPLVFGLDHNLGKGEM